MPRPPKEIEDVTPLDGSRIDLASRIGWLLRTWRVERGHGLSDIRRRLGDTRRTSITALSRTELAGERSGRLIDGYECALGLPYGALRTPIDVLCRTYDYRPVDLDPLLPPESLDDFSLACDAVAPGPDVPVTGGAWLRFAEFHARGRFGLPVREVEPLIARLVSELQRAVGLGYQQRYEALSLLRCSPYGDVVLDVTRRVVTEPGAQRLDDLVSAVCEHPTVEVLHWCRELLADDSDLVARAACLGLQNLRVVGGLPDEEWAASAPYIVVAARLASGVPTRGTALSSTIAACPPTLRAALPGSVRTLLPPPPQPARWTRTRLNIHYTQATVMAGQVARGRVGEVLLGRLLFEILFDFRASHAVTSGFLVGASAFADDTLATIAETALTGTDELTRERAGEAFGSLMLPTDAIDPEPFLASADQATFRSGLRIAGFAGHRMASDTLLRAVADPDLLRDALFAAGMAQHPVLHEIVEDPSYDETARARAAWWIRAGGRVLDPVSPA